MAVGSLLERDLHGVAQVGAPVDVVAPAAGPTGAEDVPEDVPEDIREAARAPGSATRKTARIGVDPGMAETIVGFALGRFRQDLVGLLGLLELASADLSFGLRSGWYFIASFR